MCAGIVVAKRLYISYMHSLYLQLHFQNHQGTQTKDIYKKITVKNDEMIKIVLKSNMNRRLVGLDFRISENGALEMN